MNIKKFIKFAERGNLLEVKRAITVDGVNVNAVLDGRTALHAAAEKGQLPVVEYLISAGANLNAIDEDENTPMHFAAEGGHLTIVSKLLISGANPIIKNLERSIPFRSAIDYEKWEIVEYFVRYRTSGQNQTLIHLAVIRKDEEVLQDLLKAENDHRAVIDVNAKDYQGDSAIHWAIRKNLGPEVISLLQAHIDINAQNDKGNTPLHVALESADLYRLVTLLINAKADVTIKNNESQTPLHLAAKLQYPTVFREVLDQCSNVDPQDKNGSTPLHIAVEASGIDEVKALINRAASVNLTNIDGNTPLHLAASNGYSSLVSVLMAAHAVIDTSNNDGRTPLHLAASEGRFDVVEQLVTENANINAKDNLRKTPFELAVKERDMVVDQSKKDNLEKVIKCLVESKKGLNQGTLLHSATYENNLNLLALILKEGADVDSRDKDFNTPLHLVARKRYLEIAKSLLNLHADVNAKNLYGDTPIYHASGIDYLPMVEILISHGANVNSTTNDLRTPLHMAASAGYLKVVEALVGSGAYVNSQDKGGNTPLSEARKRNHQLVTDFLMKKGAFVDILVNGQGSIHRAAEQNDQGALIRIIEEGGNIDFRDSSGRTALHYAAYQASLEMVSLLLDKGATPDIQDNLGRTPFESALQSELDTKLVVDFFVRYRDKEGNALISLAAQKGPVGLVKSLLNNGADVYVRNNRQEIPLHIAVLYNHPDITDELIRVDYSTLCARDHKGTSPLHIAALKGYLNVLEKLIESMVDVNVYDNDFNTPLHFASTNGSLSIVTKLIQAGAIVNSQNVNQITPIWLATKSRSLDVLEKLVDEGADINVRQNEGLTPLHLASSMGYLEGVKKIEKLGAYVYSKDFQGRIPFELVKEPLIINFFIGWKDSKREDTLLHYVSREDNTDLAKLLIANHIDINAKNRLGWTSRNIAVQFGSNNVNKLLIERGADDTVYNEQKYGVHAIVIKGNYKGTETALNENPNAINSVDNVENTLLHYAAQFPTTGIATLLIDRGASVNVKNYYQMTPLHLACGGDYLDDSDNSAKSYFNVVKDLIDSGANISATDIDNNTPLIYATRKGHLNIVKKLILLGANPIFKNSNQRTTFELATKYKRQDIIKYYKEEYRYAGNNTLLHLAARDCNLNLIESLLSEGNEVNVENDVGNLPLHEAILSSSSVSNLKYPTTIDVRGSSNSSSTVVGTRGSSNSSSTVVGTRGSSTDARGSSNSSSTVVGARGSSTDARGSSNSSSTAIDARGSSNSSSTVVGTRGSSNSSSTVVGARGSSTDARGSSNSSSTVVGTRGSSTDARGSSNSSSTVVGARGSSTDARGSSNSSSTVVGTRGSSNSSSTAIDARGSSNSSSTVVGARGSSTDARGSSNSSSTVVGTRGSSTDARGSSNSSSTVVGARGSSTDARGSSNSSSTVVGTRGSSNSSSTAIDARGSSNSSSTVVGARGSSTDARGSSNSSSTVVGARGSSTATAVNDSLDSAKSFHTTVNGDLALCPTIQTTPELKSCTEEIEKLIKAGSDVNAFNNAGDTPLHLAAGLGKLDIVKHLISFGAIIDFKQKNSIGNTALHEAAQNGHLNVLGYLVDKGAIVDIKNTQGRTLLHLAALNDRLDIAKFLLQKKADIFKNDNDDKIPFELAFQVKASKVIDFFVKDYIDEQGNAMIHLILQKAHLLRLLTTLLEQGTNVYAPNSNGDVALHIAIRNSLISQTQEIMGKMGSYYVKNNEGITPLHLVALKDLSFLIGELVHGGINIDDEDNEGNTPLLIAVGEGNMASMKKLIEKGADVNAKNVYGNTPLHIAVVNNKLDALKLLVEAGANVDVKNNDSKTPLDLAIKAQNLYSIMRLKKAENVDFDYWINQMSQENCDQHLTDVDYQDLACLILNMSKSRLLTGTEKSEYLSTSQKEFLKEACNFDDDFLCILIKKNIETIQFKPILNYLKQISDVKLFSCLFSPILLGLRGENFINGTSELELGQLLKEKEKSLFQTHNDRFLQIKNQLHKSVKNLLFSDKFIIRNNFLGVDVYADVRYEWFRRSVLAVRSLEIDSRFIWSSSSSAVDGYCYIKNQNGEYLYSFRVNRGDPCLMKNVRDEYCPKNKRRVFTWMEKVVDIPRQFSWKIIPIDSENCMIYNELHEEYLDVVSYSVKAGSPVYYVVTSKDMKGNWTIIPADITQPSARRKRSVFQLDVAEDTTKGRVIHSMNSNNQHKTVTSIVTRQPSWVNGCISWVKNLAANTFFINKNDNINVKSDNKNIPQSTASVDWNNFLNNENIALASCVADALDDTSSKRYQNLISKGVEVVPNNKIAVEFALRKFDSFVEGKIRNLGSKEQARIHVELKDAYPEIIASLERGVEFSGNVGLDNVLEKCKKCFCTNVLPKDKVSTCLSEIGVTKLGGNINR